MSVRRGSGSGVTEIDEIDTMGDIESQIHTFFVAVAMDSDRGPDLSDSGQEQFPVLNQPVANDRASKGQVVELVAAECLYFTCNFGQDPSDLEAAPGNIWMDFELFFDDDSFGIDIEGRDPKSSDVSVLSGGASQDFQDSISPNSDQVYYSGDQTIIWATTGLTKPIADDTDGRGGAGPQTNHYGHTFVNYRDHFGFGPLVPYDGRVQGGAVWDWSSLSQSDVKMRGAFQTYWDIWDLEEPESLRLRDAH